MPQVSVLGSLIFIIYTNDIPFSLSYSKTILNADYTTVYVKGRNAGVLSTQMNSDLTHIRDWFKANKLSVIIEKTKFMLFSCNLPSYFY